VKRARCGGVCGGLLGGGVVVVILVGVEGVIEGVIVEKSMLYGVGVVWSGLTTSVTAVLTDRFV
jgi:hypothetical protein